jgi:hypothetical protein
MMNKERTMFTADQVWALAIAADRINGGYLKEPVYDFNVDQRHPVKEANKLMLKNWIRARNFTAATAADLDRGREVRHYFNGFLLKQISGKINDFEKQALRIAQMDEFNDRHSLEFAIVSCLPSVMLRDQSRKDQQSQIRSSTQLPGSVGDRVQGSLEVLDSKFNANFDKYRITGRMGDSFVDFWFSHSYDMGTVKQVKAKIKQQRGDKTTQLNYVKIIG